MKKALLITFLSLFTTVCLAQESSHLKFKGIPIDGEYKAFAQKLVQKGFSLEDSSEDGIVLTGTFMATSEVTVLVFPEPSSKNVFSVSAMIDAGDKWPIIEKKYYKVVDLYKEKYGEPTQHVEEFTVEVHNDDFFKKNALQEGQCNYESLWETDGGRIVVSLSYFQFNYYVICAYVDEQNVKARRQTMIDDI